MSPSFSWASACGQPSWDYPILINLGINLSSTMASGPVPEAAKQPKLWCSLHHTSLLGWCFHVAAFCLRHSCCMFFPNNSICPQYIFPIVLWSAKGVFGKLLACCNICLESSCFLHGVLPWIPCLFNVLRIWLTQPVFSYSRVFSPHWEFCVACAGPKLLISN